jgi:hypothetical protein
VFAARSRAGRDVRRDARRNNYRACTVSGENVPADGWFVDGGGWMVQIGAGGMTCAEATAAPAARPSQRAARSAPRAGVLGAARGRVVDAFLDCLAGSDERLAA